MSEMSRPRVISLQGTAPRYFKATVASTASAFEPLATAVSGGVAGCEPRIAMAMKAAAKIAPATAFRFIQRSKLCRSSPRWRATRASSAATLWCARGALAPEPGLISASGDIFLRQRRMYPLPIVHFLGIAFEDTQEASPLCASRM
jgi:hypothetical protein